MKIRQNIISIHNFEIKISSTLVKMISAYGIYDENVLLNRLFGGYRLVYVGNSTGMGCSYDDEVGKKLFEVSPSEVPSEEYFPLPRRLGS